jgi:tripartite-type tricarboxylate transporter receptor subunit TctC
MFVLLALASAHAFAQAFPARPITMIVPYAAGGSADVVARPLAAEMGKVLGENVVVELRPGAGGNIGAEYVAKSARPDGYTILLASLSLATNVSLMKLNFDPRKDLAPIGGICTFPNVLVVSAQDPARTVQDIVARARAEPGKLTFGSSGPGTSSHLAGELLSAAANIQLVHVPYKGSGAVYPDLIARRVTMLFDLSGSASGHIKGGQVKALATTGAKRAAALPDVPTLAEQGVKGAEAGGWLALLGPAGIPAEIVSRLHREITGALTSPDAKERLSAVGLEVVASSPEQYTEFLKGEVEKWGDAVRRSGARAE